MATVPPNVAAARQQVIDSDYYALGYLALCVASYSAEKANPKEVEAAIAANVPLIGQIGDVPGKWTLDWGPGITSNFFDWKANLLFVASYRDPASNLPIFTAVVIRGTDTTAGFFGVITQLREDVEPGCQVQWPGGDGPCATEQQSASSQPYVAKGTYKGFQDLITLSGTNHTTQSQQFQSLTEFLAEFLPTVADTESPLPLVVTGHSLGGCQTSPVALWVGSQPAAQSGITIVPNSFAAPTAGNQAYADLYLKTFPHARRWFNTFDLVPMAYSELQSIHNLWSAGPFTCGIKLPWWGKPLLAVIEDDVAKLQYAHEGGTATRQLTGSCGKAATSWGGQLEYQHFAPCGYWNLMIAQYASSLGSLQYPQWVTPPPLQQCS
jgi:hypothetical protein